MNSSMFLQLGVVVIGLLCGILAAPPQNELPPVNESTGTLREQHEAIKVCWEAARAAHVSPPPAGDTHSTNQDCDKLIHWYEDCKCYKSVIESGDKTAILKYYPLTGLTDMKVFTAHPGQTTA